MQPVDALEPYVEQVYKRVLTAITRGELRPGQKIPQAEVAASFGVSRQPVSHALHLLRQQGLIEPFGRKGLAVSAVQVDHIRNLYQIRGQLDGLAARMAAERVQLGQIEPAQLDAVREVLLTADAQGGDAPIEAILEMEMDFHCQIYRLSGNTSIETTLAGHWPHLMRAMALIHGHRQMGDQARREHEAILSAIAAGQPALAERQALAHAHRAGVEIASHLESTVLTGRAHTTTTKETTPWD
jgi:DNA-binding GntR family transcriptional regulator